MSTRPPRRFPTRLEQLVAAFSLTVVRVLDLQPRRTVTVALIATVRPFRDDAFEIALAGKFIEACAAGGNRLEQHQPRVDARHDARQSALALHQGLTAEIFAVDEQHVEREELPPFAPEQEVVKATGPVRRQARDLPVQDRTMCTDGMRDLFCKVGPTLVDVAVARDELTVMAVHMRQCAEPVELYFR